MTVKEYLECYYNKFENTRKVTEYNKALCKEYPFLKPTNVWTGKEIEDYDYSFTWLDYLPDGWRIAFGEDLIKDLKTELESINYVDKYMITQIKEKYGFLHWYDNGCTDNWNRNILPKYEELSRHTCIECGKPAKYVSKGWISSYCEDCANKRLEQMSKYYNDRTITMNDLYDKIGEDR